MMTPDGFDKKSHALSIGPGQVPRNMPPRPACQTFDFYHAISEQTDRGPQMTKNMMISHELSSNSDLSFGSAAKTPLSIRSQYF